MDLQALDAFNQKRESSTRRISALGEEGGLVADACLTNHLTATLNITSTFMTNGQRIPATQAMQATHQTHELIQTRTSLRNPRSLIASVTGHRPTPGLIEARKAVSLRTSTPPSTWPILPSSATSF